MNAFPVRQRNPVYEHLTRNRRWPSVRATILITAALSLLWTVLNIVIFANSITLSSLQISSSLWIVIWLSMLVFVISPMITAILTTINLAQSTQDQQFALVRLTGISSNAIVEGYVGASIFHLRILSGVCYGLLLPLFVTIPAIMTGLSGEFYLSFVGAAIGIVLVGTALGTVLNWVALCCGIWAALRFRSTYISVIVAAGNVFLNWMIVSMLMLFTLWLSLSISDGRVMLIIIVLAVSIMFLLIGGEFLKAADELL